MPLCQTGLEFLCTSTTAEEVKLQYTFGCGEKTGSHKLQTEEAFRILLQAAATHSENSMIDMFKGCFALLLVVFLNIILGLIQVDFFSQTCQLASNTRHANKSEKKLRSNMKPQIR